MKVLHIDDNKEVRDLYSEMFTARNHSIRSIHDGKEGLDLVVKNDYDLILLDMYMPKYSGVQFLHDLKNKRSSELKKVIVVSLLEFNESQVEDFLNFGIHSVLKKTINLKELENIEKNVLRAKNTMTV